MLDISIHTDSSGRLIATFTEDGHEAIATASNVPDAADDLLAAVLEAETGGYGECLWIEGGGEYRWMIRRNGARGTLVVLWSSGTITGWQHVARTDGDFEWLAGRLRAEIDEAGRRVAR